MCSWPTRTARPRRSHRPRPERCLEGAPLTEPDGIRSGSPGQEVTGPWFGDGSGKGLAIRHSGYVLLGGASGAGSLLLNTKASQDAACSRAPAAIVPGREPESHDAGVSLLAKNGSHPAAADFSDEPEAVLWRRPHIAPYRIRPSVVRDGLAGQCGTENGHVVYARLISAPGPHAAVAAAQVRRKAGRSVAGGCGTGPVADKRLIMSEIMICPVWFCRQVKCSFA